MRSFRPNGWTLHSTKNGSLLVALAGILLTPRAAPPLVFLSRLVSETVCQNLLFLLRLIQIAERSS